MCDQGLGGERQRVGASIVLVVSQAPRLLLWSSRLSRLYQVSPLARHVEEVSDLWAQ